MLRRITLLAMAGIMLITCVSGCSSKESSPRERIETAAEALQTAGSLEIETNLRFSGEIEQNGLAEDLTMEAETEGQVRQSPYTASWNGTAVYSGLSENRSEEYEMFSLSAGGEIKTFMRTEGSGEWKQTYGRDADADRVLADVIGSIVPDKDKEMAEDLIPGTLQGEALEKIVTLCLGRNGTTDLSGIQWESQSAPAELRLDSDGRAVRLKVNTESIGEGFAEAITNRLGMKITIAEFSIEVDFGMYGRIKNIPVPAELSGEGESLF